MFRTLIEPPLTSSALSTPTSSSPFVPFTLAYHFHSANSTLWPICWTVSAQKKHVAKKLQRKFEERAGTDSYSSPFMHAHWSWEWFETWICAPEPTVIYYSARNQFERFRVVLGINSQIQIRFSSLRIFGTIRFFRVFGVRTHTMWLYIWLCCGLCAPTQFHFECCGVRDDSWWRVCFCIYFKVM